MKCNICSISNPELLQDIETILEQHNGLLPVKERNELLAKYTDHKAEIDKITDSDCSMHWNFHQGISREAIAFSIEDRDDNTERKGKSLTEDINKDEAAVLYKMLNEQSATFTCMNRKIASAMEKLDPENINQMAIHPNIIALYNSVSDSIRATVRELKSMNESVNGEKNDSLAGLKALAAALRPTPAELAAEAEAKATGAQIDMTTKEFDD